ncbi:MAG: PhzF family phenazine biosynthesis protein [Sedimenticolaceae bacterium]
MTQRFYMVDVFAEQPFSGNPLAVFVGTDTLSGETMQRLAAEINFSETTFVSPEPEDDGSHRVRIFTPAREIDFAGHPILGTAWVLRHYVASSPDAQMVLNIALGRVPVTFETAADGSETAWFVAPPMSFGATSPREPIAAALGLEPGDIDTRWPIQVVSAGTSATLVPLCSLDALRRSVLDLKAFSPLAAAGFPPLVYLFCQQARQPQNDLSARFFFDAHGVREDPATGNGAAFLGAYLLAHQVLPGPGFEVRIEQGHEIRRPSLVRLRGAIAGGTTEVAVGGSVVATMRGELL